MIIGLDLFEHQNNHTSHPAWESVFLQDISHQSVPHSSSLPPSHSHIPPNNSNKNLFLASLILRLFFPFSCFASSSTLFLILFSSPSFLSVPFLPLLLSLPCSLPSLRSLGSLASPCSLSLTQHSISCVLNRIFVDEVGGWRSIWMRESGVGVTDAEAEVDAEAEEAEVKEVEVKEVVMKLLTTSK
jgi:hypothetical protein